jgi:hypothetical protein
MRTRAAVIAVFCLALVAVAAPAQAQYPASGSSDRATGEIYRVEVSGFLWNPTPNIAITSEGLGIPGTAIDFVDELGIEKSTFRQIRVTLRPGTKHKFRFEFTPINYEAVATLRRDVVFNGITYPIALPVGTDLDWNAYRFAYEWDFVYLSRGFVGLVLEAKYTDVKATLENVVDTQFARARAPIPAIGIIGRGYITPNISITGEFSGIRLPESLFEDYRANYYDFDLYGTVNFNDYVGAQVGYRSFDIFYRIDADEGELTLKGLYFGGVVRF